ncbi:MAG TPA: hypothetical protein VL098_08180 [Flavipsychrobacter sp.]|nr:hypothetical protein [Flavipsychrobacter sp.]
MFETEFANAEMICIPENIFEERDWAILEWIDPKGLRGCGFFRLEKTRLFFSGAIGINCHFLSYTIYQKRMEDKKRSSNWHREEIILALDLYFNPNRGTIEVCP